MEIRNTLHKSVQDILEYIERITGKGFKFIEKPDLVEFAGVKIARPNMDAHIVVYKPQHNKLVSHLIAHECGHIKRIYETPADKRFSVATTPEVKYNALRKIEIDIHGTFKKNRR